MTRIIKNKILQIVCIGAMFGFSACGGSSGSSDGLPSLSAKLMQGHVLGTLKLTWTPQQNVGSVPIISGKVTENLNNIENIVVVPKNFSFKPEDINATSMQIIGWPGDRNINITSGSVGINVQGLPQETDCKAKDPQKKPNLEYSCVNKFDVNPAHDIKGLVLPAGKTMEIDYITKTYNPLSGITEVKKIGETLGTIGMYNYPDQKWVISSSLN